MSSWAEFPPSSTSGETLKPTSLREINNSSSDDSLGSDSTLICSSTSLPVEGVHRDGNPLKSPSLSTEPNILTKSITPRTRTRHDRFYLSDDKVVFLVEETLYRVHLYFFEQYSEEFALRYKLYDRFNPGAPAFIHLEDTKTCDFEQFLTIFYPSTLSSPYPETKTVEQWTSILRLATKWKFLSLRELAVQQLSNITSPIDKVLLGHVFDLPEWLPLAYAELCERDKPLTIEEGRRIGELGQIGGDIVIRLWQAWHEMKSPSLHLDRATAINTVKKIFELISAEPESESSLNHEGVGIGVGTKVDSESQCLSSSKKKGKCSYCKR